MHRSRRLAVRLGLALASGFAGLTIAELSVRIFARDALETISAPVRALGVFDPDVGWRLATGVDTRVVAGELSYAVSTNSRGWRDREHTGEARPGTKRIVLLGDSIAWGWGVDVHDRFGDRLERALEPSVEIVNLSAPGYGTDQELLLLEGEGWRYRPDLVLVCFLLEDVYCNALGGYKPRLARDDDGSWHFEHHPVLEDPERWRGGSTRWLRALGAHSALVRLVSQRHAYEPDAKASLPEPMGYEDACAAIADPRSSTYEALRRIARSCADRSVRACAFLVPYKHDRYVSSPAYDAPVGVAGPQFRTFASQQLAVAGEQLGVATCSVDAALLAATRSGETLHCSGDAHLNARGHEIVASVLAPWLKAELARVPHR